MSEIKLEAERGIEKYWKILQPSGTHDIKYIMDNLSTLHYCHGKYLDAIACAKSEIGAKIELVETKYEPDQYSQSVQTLKHLTSILEYLDQIKA